MKAVTMENDDALGNLHGLIRHGIHIVMADPMKAVTVTISKTLNIPTRKDGSELDWGSFDGSYDVCYGHFNAGDVECGEGECDECMADGRNRAHREQWLKNQKEEPAKEGSG